MDDLLDPVNANETTEAGNVEASANTQQAPSTDQAGAETGEAPAAPAPTAGPAPAPAVTVTVNAKRVLEDLVSSAPWRPDPALLAKIGEMNAEYQKAEDLAQLKADAVADYNEKIKAAEARAKTLRHEVQDELWYVERYDSDAGVAYQRNRLDGETRVRPYTPPPQQALPFDKPLAPPKAVAAELEGVEVGLYGDTSDVDDPGRERPYRVTAVAPDSVVVEFCDGSTQRVEATDWTSFGPDPDIDQQEYRDEFEREQGRVAEERAEWEQGALNELAEDGRSFEALAKELCTSEEDEEDGDSSDEERSLLKDALDRLIDAGKVHGTIVDGETLYSLAPAKTEEASTDAVAPPPAEPVSLPQSLGGQKLLKAGDAEGKTVDELAAEVELPKAGTKKLLEQLAELGLFAQGKRTGQRGKPPTTYSITDAGKAAIVESHGRRDPAEAEAQNA